MPPAELTADMAAADGDFAARHGGTAPHFDPGADAVAVGAELLQLHFEKVPGVVAGIAPQLRVLPAMDDHEVDKSVEVEVGQRRAARHAEAGNAGSVARLSEFSVAALEKEVIGVL